MSEQAQTVKIAKIPADGADREVSRPASGYPERDVGGTAGTAEVTDTIIEALRADAVTS